MDTIAVSAFDVVCAVVDLQDLHYLGIRTQGERFSCDVNQIPPAVVLFHVIAHAVDVGLETRISAVGNVLELRGDEDVGEAADQRHHPGMNLPRRVQVDVYAVDVLWPVDGAQHSLHLAPVNDNVTVVFPVVHTYTISLSTLLLQFARKQEVVIVYSSGSYLQESQQNLGLKRMYSMCRRHMLFGPSLLKQVIYVRRCMNVKCRPIENINSQKR